MCVEGEGLELRPTGNYRLPLLHRSVGDDQERPLVEAEEEMINDPAITPKVITRNERRRMTREEVYFNERSRGVSRREARERSRVISHAIAQYVREEAKKYNPNGD